MFTSDHSVPRQPKISLVLSSGGLKPVAAVSLFEFLDEQSIPVNLMVGCSAGSIISALRGIGYGTREMIDFFRGVERFKPFDHIDYRALLGLAKLPFGKFNMHSGILHPQKYRMILKETFGDTRIEDLRPKVLMQTTDVSTGEGVILDRGLVCDALYASSAIFPLLPPIEFAGRWLSDGYYTSPLPVSEAVKQGMDVIIAVTFFDPIDMDAHSYTACLSNYYSIQGDATTRYQMALSIDMHTHEIVIIQVPFKNPVNIWDIDYIPEIIELGRIAIEARKNDILAAIKHYSRP
ncbi:MAG TPA: patatin-like phospholipase family protein [Syntrophales bacterium]|nr:patatin-like phospholipase family protein [Syntrophales bacterium]HPN08256.1 patatin-like phospholipase family protein [Syntrophales bacterium]HPX81185.1 patatin-like phospholipase family protein [Syntrophales bacterium]HQA83482.1 patatin-like phospholipase family protein [Syntrophales bacterium]